MNAPASGAAGNAKTVPNQPTGPTNTKTTGKKRQIEVQAGPISEESAPLPPKNKKMRITVESSQPSVMNADHSTSSNTKTVESLLAGKGSKKRPSQAGNHISISTDTETPARPPKKAKVAKAPIRRTGKSIVHKRHALTKAI